MQPPEGGQQPGPNRFAEGVWRASERRDRALEIVGQERRLGGHAADGELFVPGERRRSEMRREKLRRIHATASFERVRRARQQRLERR